MQGHMSYLIVFNWDPLTNTADLRTGRVILFVSACRWFPKKTLVMKEQLSLRVCEAVSAGTSGRFKIVSY